MDASHTVITNPHGLERRIARRPPKPTAGPDFALSADDLAEMTDAEIREAAGLRPLHGDHDHDETTATLDAAALALREDGPQHG